MPNLVPSDVHVNVPVGTEKKSRAAAGDGDWRVRLKDRKKKTKQIQYSPDWLEKMRIQKKFHSAQNRRDLAGKGNALSDGSYPIGDAEDLHSAAVLARSGHGDVGAAKALIARRARELGVSNPLDEKSDSVKKSVAGFEPLTSCFSRLTE